MTDALPAGQPTGRLAWVDIARGVLVLLVVLGHAAYFMSRRGMDASVVTPMLQLTQEVRIPALFFLSGMLFVGAAARPWRLVLRNRVLLLGWLVVVWLGVEVLVRGYVLQQLAVPTPEQFPRYVLGQLALPEDYLWFIWGLMVMALLGRALAKDRWAMVVVFVVMTTGLLLFPDLGKQTGPFVSRAPFFLLGLASATWVLRMRQRHVLLVAAPVTVLFVLGAGLRAQDRIGPLSPELAATLVSLVGLPVAAGAAVLLARLPGTGVLTFLGRRTLPLYVLHMPLLLLSFHAVRTWGREWSDPRPSLTLFLLVVSNVAICLLAWWVFRRIGLRGFFDLPHWVPRLFDRVWPPPAHVTTSTAAPPTTRRSAGAEAGSHLSRNPTRAG